MRISEFTIFESGIYPTKKKKCIYIHTYTISMKFQGAHGTPEASP